MDNLVESPPAGAGGSLDRHDLPFVPNVNECVARLTALLPRRESEDFMWQGLNIFQENRHYHDA